MKKILITAFEPFGGSGVNTSALVLEKLPGQIGGYTVEKALLPVVFGKAAEAVPRCPADAVFLLGEAGGREAVTPERRGRNLRNTRMPDNEGNQPEQEKILPDAPEEYLTAFPLEEMIARMQAEGYGISLSEDAGTYVCNDTYFLTGMRNTAPVQFIHVPAKPEQAGAYARTVERLIGLCLESQAAATAKKR